MSEHRSSERTLKLFEALHLHSARSRNIVVALNFFMVFLFAAGLNEKFGGTRPRVDVRFWSSRLPILECLTRSNPARCDTSIAGEGNASVPPQASTEWMTHEFARKDELELNILRQSQFAQFETAKIPIIGIEVSATDITLLAALALLILFIWLKLAISQERRVLTLLIYPLSAAETDEEARFYWGDDDAQATKEEKCNALKVRIADLRKDIVSLREAISSQFLFLYSKSRRARLEKYLGLLLITLPVALLIASLLMDFYWDFYKAFKETGEPYYAEMRSYATRLEDVATLLREKAETRSYATSVGDVTARQEENRASAQLQDAASDLRWESTELLVKRIGSAALLVFSTALAWLVWKDARRMSSAVAAMYNKDNVPKPEIE